MHLVIQGKAKFESLPFVALKSFSETCLWQDEYYYHITGQGVFDI